MAHPSTLPSAQHWQLNGSSNNNNSDVASNSSDALPTMQETTELRHMNAAVTMANASSHLQHQHHHPHMVVTDSQGHPHVPEAQGHASTGSGADIQSRASTSNPRFTCSVCQRSFGRVEHLTRHSRIHQDERALKCAICSKGFYRIDALRRHEQVHQHKRRSSLPKGVRACVACASGRRKCSGERPCSSCEKRGTECRYRSTSTAPKQQRSVVQDAHSLSNTGSESTGFSPREDHTHENGTMTPGPQNVFATVNTGQQTSAPWPTVVPGSSQMENQGYPQVVISSSAAHGLNPGIVNVGLSMGHLGAQQEHISPGSMNTDSNMSFGGTMQQTPPAMPRDDFWYQNSLSAINWLSDAYLPDYEPPPEQSLMMIDQSSRNMMQDSSRSFQQSTYLEVSDRAPPSSTGVPTPARAEASQDGPSPASLTSTKSQETGQYYVDGDGARLPRIRSRKRRGSFRSTDGQTPSTHIDGQSQNSLQFPDQERFGLESQDSIPEIGQETYSEILRRFSITCMSNAGTPTFERNNFPSLRCISYFVHLYQENFRSILPFTHPATFDTLTISWLLVIAMASIGSHYAEVESSWLYSSAMNEFLHRAIDSISHFSDGQQVDSLVLIQAKILSCIGILYSGEDRLTGVVYRYRNDLASFCELEWPNSREYQPRNNDVADNWKLWIYTETLRRTGYTIWLLDCMWVFHARMRPVLSLEDADIPIPCQDALWDSSDPVKWSELHTTAAESPSLNTAIQLLYVEKHLPRSTSEFSRILLIHGLFRRSWEVEQYHQQPLAQWTPTANKQSLNDVLSASRPVWLPGIPTFAKWRNSTCDCLDILHWQANSTIGAAAGMEHPTVLHLHLARVILLTPFRNIVSLAMALTDDTSKTTGSASTFASDRNLVQRWATEDQYKARLAMIHAGVVFWHVRRYSVDGFYEPASVFLAALALWAYGLCASQNSRASQPAERDSPDSDDEGFPTAMQLDRPADDELVQLFVKRGATMQANLMGVGNLCGRKGPKRVLVEGRKLILKLEAWGTGRKFLGILSRLIDRMDDTTSTMYISTTTLPRFPEGSNSG